MSSLGYNKYHDNVDNEVEEVDYVMSRSYDTIAFDGFHKVFFTNEG